MTDLVTLQEYKTYKGISTTDQDTVYTSLISQVSTLIKTYCNRSFIDNWTTPTITQWYDGFCNTSIFVDEFPINAITSVEVSIDGGTTLTPLVLDTDYFVDKALGEITTGKTTPFVQGSGIHYNSLKIVYTGGFQATPDDLKLVTLDLVNYYVTAAYNPNKRLQSSSIDTVSFAKLGDSSFPPHIKRVLDLYRSIRV